MELKSGGALPDQRFAVVGVVGPVLSFGLEKAPQLQVYFSYQQWPQSMRLVLKTHGDPAIVSSALRREVAAWDKTIPVYDVHALEQNLSVWMANRQRLTLLLGMFACLAVLMTCIGIYGVLASLVVRRTQEFGVRMALGATRQNVLSLVMGRASVLWLAGIVLGLAGAALLTRALRSQLFGVSPLDPLTLVSASALLAAVAGLASYLPARHAAALDPTIALRMQ